jgi:hypothetical protein
MQKAIYSLSALAKVLNQPLQNLQRWQAEGKTGIEKIEPRLSIENVLGLMIYAQLRVGAGHTEKIASTAKDIMKSNRKGSPLSEYADFGAFRIRPKVMLEIVFEDCKRLMRRTQPGSPLYINILMYCFLFDSLLKGKQIVNSY